MKKCIISLNILYYIIFFHRFNGAESQSASSSTGQSTPETAAAVSGSTNPPVTTTITPVTLDISKSKDTDQFNYKKDGKFRTYTPKPNHVFNKVVKKDLVIWTAQNEQALKVVLMGSNRNKKFLAILLEDNTFILLHKSGKGKPWKDITSDRYDVTKLKFFGENDTELSKTDYKVIIVDLSFTFTFDSANCKKVKYANDDVWKHTDDTNFASLKSLSFDLPNNKFFVKNQSDQTKELTKAKVSVDVNASQSGSTPTTPQGTPPVTTPPPGTPTSGSGEGTDRLRSSGSTPNSGSGEGTDQGSGRPTNETQQTGSGEGSEEEDKYNKKTDYEILLEENLKNLKQ